MSLVAGEAGVSGMSGSSISSSLLSWAGGAPEAAAGGAPLNALGRTQEWHVCRSWLEMMGGGLSGRGAGAGVVGGDTANVLTMILDSDEDNPEGSFTVKVDTVVLVRFRVGVLCSLLAKSNKQEIASKSISSSPSSINLCRTLLKKGETEWGRMAPLPVEEEDEEAEPYPSSLGGADGTTGLATTKKKITHYKSHFIF